MSEAFDLPPTDSTGAPLVAASVMRKSIRTCSPQSTVIEAVLIFKDEDCGFVPVVDVGRPMGVVTDRDVALSLVSEPDLESHAVAEIMSKELIVVGPEATLVEVAQVLAANGLRRVLVVNKEGLLIGIIGWREIAPHLVFGALAITGAESSAQPVA